MLLKIDNLTKKSTWRFSWSLKSTGPIIADRATDSKVHPPDRTAGEASKQPFRDRHGPPDPQRGRPTERDRGGAPRPLALRASAGAPTDFGDRQRAGQPA